MFYSLMERAREKYFGFSPITLKIMLVSKKKFIFFCSVNNLEFVMSKKFCPFFYSKCTTKVGQDFLET